MCILCYFIGPITHISVSRTLFEILNAIYPLNFWPTQIPRPFARFQSRFEERYRNIDHIPWVVTQPYELRSRTNIERMRQAYQGPQTQTRSLSPPAQEPER